MKKGMLISVLVGLLVLTGCGNKQSKLICTNKQTQAGMEMNTTATTYFDTKGKATKVEVSMVIDAGSEENAKSAKSAMESSYDDVKQDGTKVTVKQVITPEKDDEDISIEDAKKKFVEDGYTCK